MNECIRKRGKERKVFYSVSDGFVAFCIHFNLSNAKTSRERAHNLIFKFDGNLYVISMLRPTHLTEYQALAGFVAIGSKAKTISHLPTTKSIHKLRDFQLNSDLSA